MIIYLYGPDTFRSREKLRELVQEYKKKRDPQGHSVVRLRAPEMTYEQIKGAVSSASLFNPKRMVVIEGVLSQSDSQMHEQLLLFLQQPFVQDPAGNVLVFWDEYDGIGTKGKEAKMKMRSSSARAKGRAKPEHAQALHAWLVSQKYVFQYPRLQGSDREAWIRLRMKEYGVTPARALLEALNFVAGDDPWRVDREMQKLAAYGTAGTIDPQAIHSLIERPGEPPTVFEFLDAVTEGNESAALRALQQLIAAGMEPVVLAGHLARAVRTISQVKSYLEDDQVANKNNLADTLGLHPFVARKAIHQSGAYPWESIRGIIEVLLDLEYAIKNNGGSDPALPFEIFLYRSAIFRKGASRQHVGA